MGYPKIGTKEAKYPRLDSILIGIALEKAYPENTLGVVASDGVEFDWNSEAEWSAIKKGYFKKPSSKNIHYEASSRTHSRDKTIKTSARITKIIPQISDHLANIVKNNTKCLFDDSSEWTDGLGRPIEDPATGHLVCYSHRSDFWKKSSDDINDTTIWLLRNAIYDAEKEMKKVIELIENEKEWR